jgi:hypothetical protein
MIGGLASIFGTTVIFEISKNITLYWVFTGMGIFVVLVALLMIFGVRDIILLKKKQLLLESITSTPVTQNAARRVKEKSCM